MDVPTVLQRRIEELELRVSRLATAEDRLRVLYDANPTMYFTLDHEGTVLQVNAYGAEKLGYTPDELIGRPVIDVFHVDERAAVRAQLERCLASPEEVAEWELRKVHRNGRVMWVHEAARVVEDPDHGFVVLIVCTDISELKAAQSELESVQQELELRVEVQTRALRERHASLVQSERRYRSLVESQNEMIARWNPDGTRTFVNQAYCRYAGKTEDELLGTSFFPDVVEADLPKVRTKIASLTPETPTGLDVHRVIKADGSEAWNEWSDRALFDEAGELVEIQSVGRDVTDRVLASEELAASEARYRLLAENISDVIVTLDLELKSTYASPSVLNLLGYSPSEFCQLRIAEVLTEESLKLVSTALEEELAVERTSDPDLQRSRTVDLELRSKSGPIVLCEVKASFLRSRDGKPRAILCAIRDITEWKKTQEALHESEQKRFQNRKLEAIGKLAGGLAHDFNNLLTVIFGNLQFLESTLDLSNGPPAELVQVRRAATRGADLIRQLLAFGRRQVMDPVLLDLNELVESTAAMLPRLLGEDIEIVTDLEGEIGPIRADIAQIEQVLVNLAVNARDAMPGGGRLAFTTTRITADEEPGSEPGTHHVELSVSDTGAGIATEDRDRIFEPFFTTKPVGKGSGLGLASVYGIVQQSGGTIKFDTEEDRGTIFTLRFPDAKSPAVSKTASPVASQPLPIGRETVLLVEDDPGVRGLVRRTLEAHSYGVLEAADGEAALEICESGNGGIDLVLTDIVMPKMNGIQLVEKLGGLLPEAKILFMTGHPRGSTDYLGELGTDRTPLAKPFEPRELLQRIRDLLGTAG